RGARRGAIRGVVSRRRRRLSMGAAAAERHRQLLRPAARSVAACLAARDPGARTGPAARSGAERRGAPPPAGWDDAPYLRLDAPLRRGRAGGIRPSATEHRLDTGVFGRTESGVL